MHLSTSALAVAILGLAAALPTPPHANPAFNPPSPGNSSCPTLPGSVDTKPVEGSKPADSTKPIIDMKPVEGTKPVENTKPVIEIKPVEGTKPVDGNKPVDGTKPIEPVEDAKRTTPKPRGTIRPTSTAQYEVWTGAVDYPSPRGKVFKDGKSTDITTLLTFDFPEESKGMKCSFHFDLLEPSAAVSGSSQFDVFISQAPATKSSESWPSGNLRDHHIGRMAAKLGAEATWVSGFPAFGQSFPCPTGKYGGELVGVDSADYIEWLAGTSGPYIAWE